MKREYARKLLEMAEGIEVEGSKVISDLYKEINTVTLHLSHVFLPFRHFCGTI